jgi:hypothetical protein
MKYWGDDFGTKSIYEDPTATAKCSCRSFTSPEEDGYVQDDNTGGRLGGRD